MAQTENLTIMFVDMVGFTELTSQQSRDENMAMLRRFNGLLLPVIAHFGGRRIKSIGDAMLVVFRSPTDGVRCGMALHDAVAESNFGRPVERQTHIRVAVNVGEVRVESKDIFGEAVNVAARVEGVTPRDEIYFTEAVYLAMNKAEVPSEPAGEHKLKGIPESVRLFRVPPRQITRLVPGGEDLGAGPGELPFGGMHRVPVRASLFGTLAAAWGRAQTGGRAWWQRLPRNTAIAGAAGVIALIAVGAAALWLPADGEFVVAAETTQADGQGQAPSSAPEENRRVARLFLEQGHKAYVEGRRKDAVAAYDQALALDPLLQNDPQLSIRLVSCLSWAADVAAPLIRRFPSPVIAQELGRRTSQTGKLGRTRAARLLADLGLPHLIDRSGMAISDLQEGETCPARLDAVKRLRQLKDPKALPALRKTLEGGMAGWFQNNCLRAEAQAAIKEIERSGAKG